MEKHFEKKMFDEDVDYILQNVINRERKSEQNQIEEIKYNEVPEQISLKQAELQRELNEL